jgi:hypothetical protein
VTAEDYAADVRPAEHSRVPFVVVTALIAVLVALAVTAVIVVVRAKTSSAPKGDITQLTADMLPDKADVPSLAGATWERQFKDVNGPSQSGLLSVTPPECASPMTKGARQIGTAQWANGKARYGVSLAVPTANDEASLDRWVNSCSSFEMGNITTGSVRPLTLSDIPDWAVAYSLAIGKSPGAPTSAGVIGVYRGVMINAFYSFGSAPDSTLEDGLPKIFNAAVAKLDAV